ncbi:MAG: hypothetical protein WC458_00225 [Patescibacteria group bacterium]
MSTKIEEKNQEKIDRKILGAELADKVRKFYPYFLGFYFLALFISLWSKTWRSFFFWPAFHSAVVLFTLLFILVSHLRIFNYFSAHSWKGALKFFLILTRNKTQNFFSWAWRRLALVKKCDWLKVAVVVLVLVFSLFKYINPLEFLILLYGLISFLFILDSRYAAGAALVFLVSCPFFLIFKKDVLAEIFAIYAYYFLVITALTQIRELYRDNKRERAANIE